MGRDRNWSRSSKKGGKESGGCMSGVLQFFDFHQVQYSNQHQHQQQQQQKRLESKTDSFQGIEAPKSSLDLDAALPSTAVAAEDNKPIAIQVLPRGIDKDSASETSSLQGSKTPNLVARLMGLDLLPDQVPSPPMHSRSVPPRMRSHQSRRSTVQRRDSMLDVNESGSRSLPSTPRVSSARRSDVDPRFSLQLNKENIDAAELICSPFLSRKLRTREVRILEENKSPTTYAREIVKQVKESVGRRVGTDITNVDYKKAKRLCKSNEDLNRTKSSTPPSCSPRLRFLDGKTKRVENRDPISVCNSPKLSSSSRAPPLPLPLPPPNVKEAEKPKSKPIPKSTTKCKKATCERFTQRPNRPPPASQTAAPRKCKTPLSNTLLLQIRPSSHNIQNPKKTVVNSPLSSATSQQEEQQPKPNPPPNDRDDSCAPINFGRRAELGYVKGILQRAGLNRNAPVSVTTWFSPSQPIHPTLFHYLELSFHPPFSGPLTPISNRRLLFNLTNEILHESLKPHLGLKPWLHRRKKQTNGEQLLQQLLSRLHRFPSAKCETLQDIDGLVGLDLEAANVRWGGESTAMEEESEWVVFELERQILDSLIREEASFLMDVPF